MVLSTWFSVLGPSLVLGRSLLTRKFVLGLGSLGTRDHVQTRDEEPGTRDH
jgi:hypothetical protein